MSAERFDLRTITAQAWNNGAGLTREIACGPPGATASNFDWRVSVAEIERSAPFSLFAGVDRCIVLLGGAGVRLYGGNGQVAHRLDRAFVPFRFSGDLAVSAELLGGPSRDLNVMTRRGRLYSRVACHHGAARLRADTAVAALLLCCAGHWRTDAPGAPTLVPQQGLLWRHGPVRIDVEPRTDGAAAALLFVQLCQDAGP